MYDEMTFLNLTQIKLPLADVWTSPHISGLFEQEHFWFSVVWEPQSLFFEPVSQVVLNKLKA